MRSELPAGKLSELRGRRQPRWHQGRLQPVGCQFRRCPAAPLQRCAGRLAQRDLRLQPRPLVCRRRTRRRKKWSAIGSTEAATASCKTAAPNERVARMVAEAERLSRHRPTTEYVWGGSHRLTPTPPNGPFDCGSAVSHLLQVGGFKNRRWTPRRLLRDRRRGTEEDVAGRQLDADGFDLAEGPQPSEELAVALD